MNKEKRLLDPTTSPEKRVFHYARRPDTLVGKRVGLVDNTKFNSDKLLWKIGSILEEQHGVKGSLIRRKRGPSAPAHEEILNELGKECDMIIAGIGE